MSWYTFAGPRNPATQVTTTTTVTATTTNNNNNTGDTPAIKRFKNDAKCLVSFRKYTKLRRRCQLTRAVYMQAETADLRIDLTDSWSVKSCHPRFRRDQIAIGLSKLPGINAEAGRHLAKLIPATEYPASIATVKKYCCVNFCRSCKGARLHGSVQVCMRALVCS